MRFEAGTGRPLRDYVLSRQEFMDLFPETVLDMIHEHEVRDTEIGAAIRKALLRFKVVDEVDRRDVRTRTNVTSMVGLAVQLGRLEADAAPGIIASILDE